MAWHICNCKWNETIRNKLIALAVSSIKCFRSKYIRIFTAIHFNWRTHSFVMWVVRNNSFPSHHIQNNVINHLFLSQYGFAVCIALLLSSALHFYFWFVLLVKYMKKCFFVLLLILKRNFSSHKTVIFTIHGTRACIVCVFVCVCVHIRMCNLFYSVCAIACLMHIHLAWIVSNF